MTPETGTWQRLHPLSPLIRGGIVLLVIVGILLANMRDRIIELFFIQGMLSGIDTESTEGTDDPEFASGDLISTIEYLAARKQLIWAIIGLIVVLLLIIGLSWLSWRFSLYRITNEAVETRSGVLFRQHRRAPLERIQSVNLQRSLLARVAGLTDVQVHTGGQGGSVNLKYLSHREAKRVRELILLTQAQQRQGLLNDEHAISPVDYAGRPYSEHDGRTDRLLREMVDFDIHPDARERGSLVSVAFGRLIASVMLSSEVLIIFSVMLLQIAIAIWVPAASIATAVVLIIMLISVVYSQLNKGFNFVLSRADDGIRVGAGLTSTTTETVPFGRIHALEASQPLAWRLFGWYRVRMITAGYSATDAGQNKLNNVVLPVGDISDVVRVFETIFSSISRSTDEREQQLINAITSGGDEFMRAGKRSRLLLWFAKPRVGVHTELNESEPHQSFVRIRRGWFTRTLVQMPLTRAQSLQLSRPFMHRMLGLATLTVHTVLGPFLVRVRGLQLNDARAEFDRIAHTIVAAQLAERRTPHPTHRPESSTDESQHS